jgi:6-pyruvoyltetrahydropterin/6-carboxytetrahydropterin synthase
MVLTRRYRFAAAHVLAQPAFSSEENDRIYGKCANPAGHGHDYEVEVSVAGALDPDTGQIVAPGVLDEIFEDTIGSRYAHRLLNDEAPFGALVPTAENIAIVLRDLLSEAVSHRSQARLAHVRVVETPRNSAELGEIR